MTTETVTVSLEDLPLVMEEDLSVCKCITRPDSSYRVVKTQHRGVILEHPVTLGEFDSFFGATDLVENARKGKGTFAIVIPVYECGHDWQQWSAFWA